MPFRSLLVFVLACGLLVVARAAPVAAQSEGKHASAKKEARGAAQSWLDRVDANEFGVSWDEAAALLQKRISRESWIQTAERLRDTVKAVSDRSLATTQYRDSLQRAPSEGPFVLLKYRSTFEAGRVDELLLTVREDTTWKVVGYQVTPLRPSSTPTAPDASNP
jgi:hypothetical protein